MTGAIFHPGKVIAARNSCLRYEPYDLMEKPYGNGRPAECEQAARVGIGVIRRGAGRAGRRGRGRGGI